MATMVLQPERAQARSRSESWHIVSVAAHYLLAS
jgi:hypothetical protein